MTAMMTGQMTLAEFLSGAKQMQGHRPWPRYMLDLQGWRRLVERLSISDWTLLGLWADGQTINAALRDDDTLTIAVCSHECRDGAFPSLAQARPSAARLERAIRDLWGLAPEGLDDMRPWLDHGAWSVRRPLSDSPQAPAETPFSYRFLEAEGEGLHQIPVGPVHAGIIEPGHFRFHCAGETVVRLEERLGYVHKGIEGLARGKTIAEAARLAARVSGDSTIAYALAFARAVEDATETQAWPRAQWLRGVMAEWERVANHLGDIGAICNDAAFSWMLSQCATLREEMARAAQHCFGHRLMMDAIIPGGVAQDLRPDQGAMLRDLIGRLRPRFEKLVEIYDGKPSLQDRMVGTGMVTASLARRFGAGGFVGRASGGAADARRAAPYPPYDQMKITIPRLTEGDVNARIWLRIEEVRVSLGLIETMLADLPEGPVHRDIPAKGGEGMALVEGFRGEVLVWLRLGEDGRVARFHPRDPSWFQWPLLEAAIEGNIVADFPLCNKSFNCSYAGHDV